jgi:molecular chaperone GrpE
MAHKKTSNSAELELDHELPAADDDDSPSAQGGNGGNVAAAPDSDSELEKVRAERAAYLDRAARIQAEFENYRKRSAREQQDFREYAVADAIRSLLPVLDSLDGALKTKAVSLEDLRSGIELIDKQFHDVLAKLGVEPLEAEGQEFDPNYHQAVQMVETNDVKDNHVIDELQRGYKLKERLLRPAMVRVARNAK